MNGPRLTPETGFLAWNAGSTLSHSWAVSNADCRTS
jgi:hypothetical protein